MPFVRCVYSGDAEMRDDIATAISSAISAGMNKPEAVVFVQVTHDSSILFGGSREPCAMVEIQSIGGSLDNVVGPISDIFESVGGVLRARVFISLNNSFTADTWGSHGNLLSKLHH
jgi:hypothetical protein